MKNNKTMRLTRLSLLLVAVVAISACAPTQYNASVTRKTSQLDLSYEPKGHGGLEGRTIGVLNFRFDTKGPSQLLPGGGYRSAPAMDNELQRELVSAYTRDIDAIVTAHGARVSGPYESYEEIPYGAKERMMLLVEPKLTISLYPVQTSEKDSSMGAAHEEDGYYFARAEGVFRFREPMTNEVILVKRVKAEVKSEPYHHAYKTSLEGENIVLGLFKRAAVADFKESDNRLQRRNQAITALYGKLMAAVDTALDPRELAMHEDEIARLKKIKRF